MAPSDKIADLENKVSNPAPKKMSAEIPGGQNAVQQAAAPVAALSSKTDPIPHYLAAAICGGGGAYAYSSLRDPRAAAIAGGFAALYFSAG